MKMFSRLAMIVIAGGLMTTTPSYAAEDSPYTASELQSLITDLEAEGHFDSSHVYRQLSVHATTLSHYENQGSNKKLVRHTGGFHNLLQHQKDAISDHAFELLFHHGESLRAAYLPFDEDLALDHIEHLSVEIGPRVAGSIEEVEAAEYIEDIFIDLGYETAIEYFDIRNGTEESQNVIAIKEAEGVEDPEIVYLTAHYDSVPNAPGANDNGSGTAALLELARVMQDIPVDKEVRFVALGAEEIGLVGAYRYAETLTEEEINRSFGNFNMDMVATNWEPADTLYVNVVDGQANNVWYQANAASNTLNNDILFLFQRGASDHVAFHQVGIDAANFIWREPGTHSLEPWYHTPEDTIDKISTEKLKMVGDLIFTSVTELDY